MNIDELLRRAGEFPSGHWSADSNGGIYSEEEDYREKVAECHDPHRQNLICFYRNHGPAAFRALSVAVKALEKLELGQKADIKFPSEYQVVAMKALARIAAELKETK